MEGDDGGGDGGGSDNGGGGDDGGSDNGSDNGSSSDSGSDNGGDSGSSDSGSSDAGGDQGGDTSGDGGDTGGGDGGGFALSGGFDFGGIDVATAPDVGSIIGTTQPPDDSGTFDYGGPTSVDGPITIGDPGVGDPITDQPQPGSEPDQTTIVADPGTVDIGIVEGPPEEPGPEPEPGDFAPPLDTGITVTGTTATDVVTGIGTGIIETGWPITIEPPIIDWPIPEPEPEPSPEPEPPPEPQPEPEPGPTGDNQDNGPGPSPFPAPPVEIAQPIQVVQPAPPVTIQPPIQIPVPLPPIPIPNLMPLIINVIEPQPDGLVPQQAQVTIENPSLDVNLPGLERITQDIQTTLAVFASDLTGIAQRIADDIHTEISQLLPAELDLMQTANDIRAALVDQISTAFPASDSIAQGFASTVADNWTEIAPKVDELLTTAHTDGILNALQAIGAGGAPNISGLLDGLPGGACVSAAVKGFLAPLAAGAAFTDGLALIMAVVDSLKVFIDAALSGPVALVEQDSMACVRPELLSVSEIQEAQRRQTIADGTATDQLNRHGYKDELQAVLASIRSRLLERDDVLDAALRGMLDDEQQATALAQLGYDDQAVAIIEQLRQLLPTPTDLVSWMLRDLFPAPIASVDFDADGNATFTESSEPINFVDAFGMDLEFPKDVLPLFAQLGLSEENAHRFWQAHWELPSPQQGAEMFQRGFITDQAFNRLLRARGVEPYWRKPFREIIFNPITRVDIRRIHKLLGKDHAWLVKSYQDVGYSPDDAELLAQFTEQLNSNDEKVGKFGELTTLKSEIEGLYLDGSIDAQTATQHLVDLGYPRDHVDAFIAGAELKRQANLDKQVAAAVKQLYVTLHWDKPTATAALNREGFSDEHINRLMESWDLDRDYRELTQQEKDHRELTKSEVLEAFGDRLIDANAAQAHLETLHYTDDQIALMLELENLKVAKSDQAAVIDSLHAQFLAGTLDRAGAVAAMDAAAVTHTKREGLLAKWALELDKKQARLTVAQIQQLTTAKLITPDDAAQELRREGYSDHDAQLLLKLFGVTAVATTTREAEAAQRTAAAAARTAAAEQRRTSHGLTVAQLEKTFKGEITTEAETRAMLTELGYRTSQQDELIKLWSGA